MSFHWTAKITPSFGTLVVSSEGGVKYTKNEGIFVYVSADPAPHFHPEEIYLWKTHSGQAGEVLHEEWC